MSMKRADVARNVAHVSAAGDVGLVQGASSDGTNEGVVPAEPVPAPLNPGGLYGNTQTLLIGGRE